MVKVNNGGIMGEYLYAATQIQEVMANIEEYVIPEKREYTWSM